MTAEAQVERDEEKREAPIRRRLREESEQSLLDVMQGLTTSGAFEIKVHRRVPKTWLGKNIEGLLWTVEGETFTEADLFERFGGGHYLLEFFSPDAGGRMRPVAQRVVKIAGDPKMEANQAALAQVVAAKDEDAGLVKEALRMAERQAMVAEQRATRIEERAAERGPDPSIQLMMDELRSMRKQIADKDAQFVGLLRERGEPREADRATDRILDKLVDGDSGRVAALVAQHQAELGAARERHNAEIDRISSRTDDLLRRAEDAHKREVDALNRAHDQQNAVAAMAQTAVTEGYKREIAHLSRVLEMAQKELAELRVKKEKGLLETITEAASVKDALSALGGDGEKEESSAIERVITGILNSELAGGIAQRLATGPGAAPSTATAEELPPNQPVRMPDGRVVVRRTDESGRDLGVVELRRKKRSAGGAARKGPPVDPELVKMAVTYMEGAFRAGTTPEIFATSASSRVPDGVVHSLRARGVDDFLSDVAQLESGSPLYTIAGKLWVRKVAAILVDGGESKTE